MKPSDLKYQRRVAVALDAVLQQTLRSDGVVDERKLDIDGDRYIIFSDQHRGRRNRADDFRRSERAYNAAIAYYYKLGYTLVVLGDAEELWEERPGPVVRTYAHSLRLEARFHQAGRYIRCWGNHDDAWRYPDLVRRHLSQTFPHINVREAVRIATFRNGEPLGYLLLLHGHQGTSGADRYSWFSRLVVRYFWRNFQRLTGMSLNTPAKDWVLREKHNVAMYRWAEKQHRLVLIAGHTHRPVFKSRTHAAQIREELDAALQELGESGADERLRRQVAELCAELEWVRAQEEQKPAREAPVEMSVPCYFNTGCCCYLDGDVTGLEIAEGEIRLVRWPDDDARPRPHILAVAGLGDVMSSVSSSR